jgi:hypothetical protein
MSHTPLLMASLCRILSGSTDRSTTITRQTRCVAGESLLGMTHLKYRTTKEDSRTATFPTYELFLCYSRKSDENNWNFVLIWGTPKSFKFLGIIAVVWCNDTNYVLVVYALCLEAWSRTWMQHDVWNECLIQTLKTWDGWPSSQEHLTYWDFNVTVLLALPESSRYRCMHLRSPEPEWANDFSSSVCHESYP